LTDGLVEMPDVERMPGKVSGAWVVKGTRVPVQAVVDNAEDGYTPEEIAREIFEGLPLDRVQSVIRFAKDATGFLPNLAVARHNVYACSSLIHVGGSNSRNSPSQGS
jgi:uncharacterized protein (DUF433 family)